MNKSFDLSRRAFLSALVVTTAESVAVGLAGCGAEAPVTNGFKAIMSANEMAASAACKAYCSAQENYRRTDYNHDRILEYAQTLSGTNSLLETKAGSGDVALIDRAFAHAEGGLGVAVPKMGYYFKVLTRQGANAPGGAKDYIQNGHMTLGYALVAYPSQYGETGRNTFIVCQDGLIYEKDLGAATQAIAEKMSEYNPDSTWIPAE